MKRAIITVLLLPFGSAFPLFGADSPIGSAAIPTILSPAVHPEQDTSHLDNLKISTSARLFYIQETYSGESQPQDKNEDSASDETPVATLKIPKLVYPIVQLENSQYVATLVCSASRAWISFNDQHAFQTALSNWQGVGKFVIISYDPSCGDGYEKNERNFILVTYIRAYQSSLSMIADITHLKVAEAIGDNNIVHVEVGGYTPSSSGGFSADADEPAQEGDDSSDSYPVKRSSAYSKDYSKSLSLNSFPTNAQSPWGSAYSIYKNDVISAFCVGCGISGQITIKGSFSLTFAHGLEVGNIDLTGNLHSALEIGLVATGLSKTIPIPEIPILNFPLSPLTIVGFVTLGPNLAINAGGSLTVTATGNLLAGAALDWPSISATLDLSDASKSSASGFTPQLTPAFQAQGTISANPKAYIAVRLELGITILDGKFKKTVALIEKPGVSVTATANTQVGGGGGGAPTAADNSGVATTGAGAGAGAGPNAPPTAGTDNAAATLTPPKTPRTVNITASLTNDVDFDLAGIKQFSLSRWTSAPIAKCIF